MRRSEGKVKRDVLVVAMIVDVAEGKAKREMEDTAGGPRAEGRRNERDKRTQGGANAREREREVKREQEKQNER